MADLGPGIAARGCLVLRSGFSLPAALLCCALLVGNAAASPVKPGAAIAHFELGTAAFADGKYQQALAEFQASIAIEPSPNTRFKIARCYKALGKIGSAYVQFRRTALEAQDRINATGEARFAPTRDAATAEVSALESIVPRMILALPSPTMSGLRLELDGVEIPSESLAMAMPIDPGAHKLVAKAPRFADFEHEFSVERSGRARIPVELQRKPSAEITLELASRPAGMAVAVDDIPWPPDEYDRPRYVDPGVHRVEVRVPGYVPYLWQKQLADQDAERVHVTLRGDIGSLRWVALGIGGAAVVALAIGTGFGVAAQQTADEQIALDPLLRDRGTQAQVQQHATLSTALLTTGGVLAGAAIVLGGVALSRRSPVERNAKQAGGRVSWTWTPQVSRSEIGLTCLGRF